MRAMPRMVHVDPASLDRRARYGLLISVLIPRPIAWISTVDREGHRNLAPFSFFGGVSSNPPILAVSIARRRDREKDTLVNIRETGEFVVNMVDAALVEKAHQTSADVPPGVDEFVLAGLEAVASERIRPPRVARAPVAMECVVEQILPVGEDPNHLVLGRVLLFHVREDIWQEGVVDPEPYRPVARLGGTAYAHLGDIFHLQRPDTQRLLQEMGWTEGEAG
jgi:flavin reductase (DIM6/NTAB) family NADH-FMN oxidoreductase RutF